MRSRWSILLPAVPLLVVCLGGTRGAAENQAVQPGTAAYVLAGAAALTLLLRRRAPLVGVTAAAQPAYADLLTAEPVSGGRPAGPRAARSTP